MSEENKSAKTDFKENMAKVEELEKLKQDTMAKKAILDSKRISAQLEQLEQNEKELEIAKKSNFGALTKEQVEEIQLANNEYIKAAKNGMRFISEVFDEIVPFFRKNFILMGASTGEGKSTAVANIAFSVITSTNPVTQNTRRALVLTNEERAEDFYNRITSLAKGWHYTNHSKFTDEQIKIFSNMIPVLASGGRLTVIDNNHNGSHGVTTSIEGIESVFESLIANEEWYDVVIIDYYQNIINSKENSYMSENEVQAKLSRMMDKYKNIYPAPIVMMAQVNKPVEGDKIPFQYRIKGRKIIMDPATFVVEMEADRKNLRTRWTVWKSRFTEAVGSSFFTGYEKGKFIKYSSEFAERVQKAAYERQSRQMDKENGIKDVFKKETT